MQNFYEITINERRGDFRNQLKEINKSQTKAGEKQNKAHNTHKYCNPTEYFTSLAKFFLNKPADEMEMALIYTEEQIKAGRRDAFLNHVCVNNNLALGTTVTGDEMVAYFSGIKNVILEREKGNAEPDINAIMSDSFNKIKDEITHKRQEVEKLFKAPKAQPTEEKANSEEKVRQYFLDMCKGYVQKNANGVLDVRGAFEKVSQNASRVAFFPHKGALYYFPPLAGQSNGVSASKDEGIIYLNAAYKVLMELYKGNKNPNVEEIINSAPAKTAQETEECKVGLQNLMQQNKVANAFVSRLGMETSENVAKEADKIVRYLAQVERQEQGAPSK